MRPRSMTFHIKAAVENLVNLVSTTTKQLCLHSPDDPLVAFFLLITSFVIHSPEYLDIFHDINIYAGFMDFQIILVYLSNNITIVT